MTPATESTAGRRRLLGFSIGLNFLLVVGLIFLRPDRPRETPPDAPSGGMASTEAGEPMAGSARAKLRHHQNASRSHEPTPWSRLKSADLRKFAANLRAAGCPDETVCDLLRPEGNQVIATRTETARFQTNFWLSGAQLVAHRQAVEAEVSRWQQAQAELLTELGCLVEWPEEEGYRVDLMLRVAAGFLPRERQLALVDLLITRARFEHRWREQTQAVVLPADLHWLAAESRRFTEQFGRVLSAADFEEVCLRAEALLQGLGLADESVAALALTPTEFRELLRRGLRAGENHLEREFSLDRVWSRNERPSRSAAQRDADQREVLGEARAEELRLRSGPTYATTREWAEKFGLDAATPRRVFAELDQFQRTVAALAETGREQPAAVRADFQAAHEAALAQLEQNLSRVPATNRTEQLRKWLLQAAQEGWQQP
jgi:hypothetical protein